MQVLDEKKDQINNLLYRQNKPLHLSKEVIIHFLEEQKYQIKYINFQNNSINGVIKDKEKYFFKVVSKSDFDSEIQGYLIIKGKYPVNPLKKIYQFDNCSILIFEYEESIRKNKGLLHDFFVKRDVKKVTTKDKKVISNIISCYRQNYKNLSKQTSYPMDKFYRQRLQDRLIKWYEKEEVFDYQIIVNGMHSKTTHQIIDETISYFSIEKPILCGITQGDPNTLNIGTKPMFFDFATSGYNPVIGELAAIFWSVLAVDCYFAPRYHKNCYFHHEKILKQTANFEPNMTVDLIDKNLQIEIQMKTSEIRKEFIRQYIDMLDELNISIEQDIIYFLVMRILCIFDIRKMDKNSYLYSIASLHLLYNELNQGGGKKLKQQMNQWKTI